MLTDLGTEKVKSTHTRRLEISSWIGTLVWVTSSSFKQIEDLEKRLRDELEKKAEARVRAAAKRGQLLDYEETYAAEKAKLGSAYREAKNQAKLQGAALEADWGSQLAPGRWNAITPQASKLGHSIGFLDPETAQVQAVHHAF